MTLAKKALLGLPVKKMTNFKNVKKYFFKDDFDFDRDDITLHNFHPQLRIFLSINGIFFNHVNSKRRFINPMLNIALALVGTGFELLFIYHGVDVEDYSFASECFCYLVILGTVPMVYTSILYNRDKIMKLLDGMNRDFIFICKLGSEYKNSFMKGQLLIWQLCGLWMGFTLFTAFLYISNMLILLLHQSLFATQDEFTVRPLVFPMWLPYDDPYRSPNYEMFLVLDIVMCFVILQTFCTYVYTLLHYLLHYYNLMNLIIMDLDVVFDGLDEGVVNLQKDDKRRVEVQLTLNRRMKRIVSWHNTVFDSVSLVSSVYGPPLVYQVMFTSFGICITAFQIADQLEHGKFDFLYACLGIGACMQLWIPCYLGTLIRDKGFAIADACWNSGWQQNNLGQLLRPHLLLVILRSQQPITMKFTGLPNLTLETYSSVMSTSYSYFNMLRQSTKG